MNGEFLLNVGDAKSSSLIENGLQAYFLSLHTWY